MVFLTTITLEFLRQILNLVQITLVGKYIKYAN